MKIGLRFVFFAFVVFYVLPFRHTYRVGRILCLNRVAQIVKTARNLSYNKSRVIAHARRIYLCYMKTLDKYNEASINNLRFFPFHRVLFSKNIVRIISNKN